MQLFGGCRAAHELRQLRLAEPRQVGQAVPGAHELPEVAVCHALRPERSQLPVLLIYIKRLHSKQ